MARDIDYAALAVNLSLRRERVAMKYVHNVMRAIELLRRSGLPEAYVDGIQDEVLEMTCSHRPAWKRDHVYLAFHGQGGRASHMKIGVAADVKKRMAALYTGNPLPRLWVFAAPLSSRMTAGKVEQALLAHMSVDRSSGEWVRVDGLSETAAVCVVESLAEVASMHTSHPVEFERVEV